MKSSTFLHIRPGLLITLLGVLCIGVLVDHVDAQSGPAQKAGLPWLVYSVWVDPRSPGSGGLWIGHPDGSDQKRVDQDKGVLSLAVSPDGQYVAYISYDPDSVQGEKNITLNLLQLPDGTTTTLTALTTPATEMKDPGYPGATESFNRDPLQWSPDGQTLAFIGAQGQSNSADLFIYSLKTKKVTQLSSGASQAFSPGWSPDGKYILHFGVTGFGTGAGESYAGVWVARADGSGVTTLYKPTEGGEGSLGWIDSISFLAWSWHISCGNHLIRAFNVESKKQVIWVKDFYQAAAYAPSAGILVFSITDTQSGCTGSGNTLDTGLYRLSKTDLQPVKISDLAPNFLEWSPEAGAFFALMPTPESSLIQITPDGKVSEPIGDMTELPVASPDGKLWAWMDSKQNLYVADPETLTPVEIAEDAQRLAWAQ